MIVLASASCFVLIAGEDGLDLGESGLGEGFVTTLDDVNAESMFTLALQGESASLWSHTVSHAQC